MTAMTAMTRDHGDLSYWSATGLAADFFAVDFFCGTVSSTTILFTLLPFPDPEDADHV
jgi:hypothetical protein